MSEEIKVKKKNVLKTWRSLLDDGFSDSASTIRSLFPEAFEEERYPCCECGVLRTKAEGGTTFTVCDTCWDKKYKKKESELQNIIMDVFLKEVKPGIAEDRIKTLAKKKIEECTVQDGEITCWNLIRKGEAKQKLDEM